MKLLRLTLQSGKKKLNMPAGNAAALLVHPDLVPAAARCMQLL